MNNDTKESIEREIKCLEEKKKEALALAGLNDTFQHAYKIYLNSVYGFIGTPYSPLYSKDIAESVTLTGQTIIKEMVDFTNKYLNKLGNTPEETEWVIAGDTDSFSGDSLIYINGVQRPVAEVFNELNTSPNTRVTLTNGVEVIYPDEDIKTYSVTGETDLVNITRHKVTKDKWNVNGTMFTSDHSVMVYRGKELISIKPYEIDIDTDFVLKKDFNGFNLYRPEVKKCGKFTDEYVYDCEVSDNTHTVVVNDVLAHNSCVKSSRIRVNDFDTAIENVFEYIKKYNGSVKLISGVEFTESTDTTLYIETLNGNKLIKNMSRRRVCKRRFKVSAGKTSIEVTEDESLMVYRDNQLIECRPDELRDSDCLVVKKLE